MLPQFISVFMAPIRDNAAIQAALFAMLILILADMVFGVINACARGEFSSKKLRKGLIHKTGELAIVLVGVIMDGLIFAGLDLGLSGPILGVVLTSIIIMEIGSIMEISAEMNPDLQKIGAFKLLASVKENVDDDPQAASESELR